jgi:hypothetical protein
MGAQWMPPANDVWVAGNFYGAIGQDNFFALPVGTTLDLGFVQHEPGPVCTPLIEIPWDKNLRACQRFYAKSVGYSQGIASGQWRWIGIWAGTTYCRYDIRFPVEMFKTPTATLFNSGNNPNTVYIDSVNGTTPISGVNANASGINSSNCTSQTGTAPASILGMWTADCGW